MRRADGRKRRLSPQQFRQIARNAARLIHEELLEHRRPLYRRHAEAAHRVWEADEPVDAIYNGIFREMLTFMMEDPRNITACMHLHFIAKNVERMGDHATSIAEQVVYLVTGDLPDEARPKSSSVVAPAAEV